MNNRAATMMALIAAIFGAILSAYTAIATTITLARLGLPPLQVAIHFLSANDWMGYGLILLFFLVLSSPKAARLGAVGVIGGALIRLFFTANSLAAILVNPSAMRALGKYSLFYYSGPVLAFLTLCFGIAWAINSSGLAARVFALVLGVGIGLNMVAQLLLYPLQFLSVAGFIVAIPIALWFLLHYFQGATQGPGGREDER